jgi:hypothetical protein
MNQSESRSILRHGFVVVLLSLLMGFGIVKGGPQARSWMGAHVTAFILGAIIVLIGFSWDRLALSPRQRAVLRLTAIADGYLSVIAGAFAAIFGVPGPVTGGGAQPQGLTGTLFFVAFIPLLTILPFIFTGLMIFGLRSAPSGAQSATPSERAHG